MNSTPSKGLLTLGIIVGSTFGGWVPSWFGASWLSLWGIVGSTIGAIAGLILAYKFYTNLIG